MGFTKRTDFTPDPEAKVWVITGISVRTSLKSITTKPIANEDEDESRGSTTPTAKEARIPEKLICPPAPRKRRASSKCNNCNGIRREFFVPPDLESVFLKCFSEKA